MCLKICPNLPGGEFGADEFGGGGIAGGDFLRGAGGYYAAAFAATVGTHVYHIVGAFYHIEIMLYDQYGVSFVDETVEYVEKHAYVLEMKAGSGFVEYEEGFAGVAFR